MLHFEADPGQGGPPEPTPAPGPAPEPYPAPDPAPEPAPAPAPTEPAGLAYDSPELGDLIDYRAAQLLESQLAPLVPILEQLTSEQTPMPAAAAPGLAPTLDPLSETFGQDLQQLLAAERQQTIEAMQQMFAGFTQPMQERMEAERQAQVNAQGEEVLKDMLADNVSRYGDFPADPESGKSAQELVRPLANALWPAIAAQLGPTPRAAELAVEQAAQMVRDMGALYARQGVNRETTRLSAIAGARGEPGASGAAGIPTRPEPRSPSEVTARYAAEAKRLHAEGHV